MKKVVGTVVGVGILVAMFAPIWPIGSGAATICSSPEVLETLKAGFYKDFSGGGAVEIINTGPIGVNGNISLCSGETHRLGSVTGAELFLGDGAPFEYAIQPLDSGKFRVSWSPKVLILGQIVTYSYVGPMNFEQTKAQVDEKVRADEAKQIEKKAKEEADNRARAILYQEQQKIRDAERETQNNERLAQELERKRAQLEAQEAAAAASRARAAEANRALAEQRQKALDDHRRRHVAWCQSMFNGQIDPRLANGLGTSGRSRKDECIALRAQGAWDGPDTN
jgi:flagellar biosynthesis GTPase FlhF